MPLAATELVPHIPYLRRYGQRMTGNPDAADDLVQATMERALRVIADYRPIGNLQGWLVTIMRNQFHTQYRAEQRRAAWVARAAQAAWKQPPDQYDACLLGELMQVIGQMPRGQRAVVNAVCVEGSTYSQASVELQVPIGTVRSRMARARARLEAL